MPREQLAPIIAAKAVLPKGQKLSAQLPPRCRAALARTEKAEGLPPALLEGFKPWYASQVLVVVGANQAGYDPADGADGKLVARAEALGHKHEALETTEFQLGLFDTLPAPLQVKSLCEVARKANTLPKDLQATLGAWKKGDTKALDRIINADDDAPEMRETLLLARNRAWAQWVAKRLEQPGTVFMAVGTGHLVGKGSLPEQLKAMGITATRVQ